MSAESDQHAAKQDIMTLRYLAVFGNRVESSSC